MGEIYFGRGRREQYDEYMDFINFVFGFNGRDNDFRRLLPKLYGEDDDPATNSYIAEVDGKLRGAVGAYPFEMNVCDVRLRGVGIGNVASHPSDAGKGNMTRLLTMAVDDMIKSGCDLAVLGGQRQRYNHFSFESVGVQYSIELNRTNMRHAYGEYETDVRLQRLDRDDECTLDKIAELSSSEPFFQKRERESLFDILCTWEAAPYVFTRGEEFIGYCVMGGGGGISEIHSVNKRDYLDMMKALLAERSSVKLSISDFHAELLTLLLPICESVSVGCNHMFTVFSYRRVIKAFAELKATYAHISDGELKALIHGRAGDERLLIAVRNGKVSVEEFDGEPDIELEHLEAMRFFFAPVEPGRRDLSCFAADLFPLPIFQYSADAV